MSKEKNFWKVIFWVAFIVFILLIVFWILVVIESRNSPPIGRCSSAVQCDCSKDVTRCECKYYDEYGELKGPIYCDRSGTRGGN